MAVMKPNLVVVPSVELLKTGTWNSDRGPVAITETDLQSIANAATDPMVDMAPLKLGHYDKANDGQPAYGWVSNPRVVGNKLIGDLVDVPAKLAEIAKVAYRRRSAEIRWGVNGTGGKVHKAALSALSLLGVQAPAVKGLADLEGVYFADPDSSTVTITYGEATALGEYVDDHDLDVHSDEGDKHMDPKLLAALNLSEGATDEQILAAVEDLKAKPPTTKHSDPDVVSVSKEVFEDMQRQAALGAAAFKTQRERDIEATVKTALSEGRIMPTEADKWRKRLADNYEGEVERLSEFPARITTVPQITGKPDVTSFGEITDEALAAFTGGDYVPGYDPTKF